MFGLLSLGSVVWCKTASISAMLIGAKLGRLHTVCNIVFVSPSYGSLFCSISRETKLKCSMLIQLKCNYILDVGNVKNMYMKLTCSGLYIYCFIFFITYSFDNSQRTTIWWLLFLLQQLHCIVKFFLQVDVRGKCDSVYKKQTANSKKDGYRDERICNLQGHYKSIKSSRLVRLTIMLSCAMVIG